MTSDDYDKVASLVDGISGPKLDEEFKFLISVIKDGPEEHESKLILNVLVELADMQWETYEILPDAIRRSLDEKIINVWQRTSLDSTQKLLAIIAKLGLGSSMAYLSEVVGDIVNPDVRSEIASAIAEFGGTVDDPYSGMK